MKAHMSITRAVLLGAVVIAAAVVLAQTSGAHAANQYRVEITNLRSGLKADVMWASTQPYQRNLSSRMRHSVVGFSEQPPLWSAC